MADCRMTKGGGELGEVLFFFEDPGPDADDAIGAVAEVFSDGEVESAWPNWLGDAPAFVAFSAATANGTCFTVVLLMSFMLYEFIDALRIALSSLSTDTTTKT